MKKVKILWLPVTLLLVVLGLVASKNLPATPSQYSSKNISCNGQVCNVILLVNDTLSAKHMSLYGYSYETTPFMDDYFGKGGVVFKNMSSNAPWTLASFASFLTSRYPSEINLETYQDKLSLEIPTFPEILEKSGVDTAAFYLGEINSNIFSRFNPKDSLTVEDPLTFDLALDWVKRRSTALSRKPFLMMVHNRVVHEPYDPPSPYRKLFGAPPQYPGSVVEPELNEAQRNPDQVSLDQRQRFIRQYDQEVRYVDDLTKNFISSLPKEVLDTSVIIFTSDHGEAFGEHGIYGHTQLVYEEAIHVPFMIRGPGISAMSIESSASLIDLAPTILDIFGLPEREGFQGRSVLGALMGEKMSDRLVKAELAYKIWPGGTRLTRQSTVRSSPLPTKGWVSVRKGSLKLIQTPNSKLEVYDLSTDPGELINLFSPTLTNISELKSFLPK